MRNTWFSKSAQHVCFGNLRHVVFENLWCVTSFWVVEAFIFEREEMIHHKCELISEGQMANLYDAYFGHG